MNRWIEFYLSIEPLIAIILWAVAVVGFIVMPVCYTKEEPYNQGFPHVLVLCLAGIYAAVTVFVHLVHYFGVFND